VEDVFTMNPEPSRFTYIDRARLDHKVRQVLDGGRHVAIHGESKFGKSWLRANALSKKKLARVQCMPGMKASAVIEQALGQLGVTETVSISVENFATRTDEGGGTLGYGPAEISVRHGENSGTRETAEKKPVGVGTDSLAWVAQQFRDNGSIPVFEDFHNLSTVDQFAMAYVMKALGEWNVPCVVVGIWTDTHQLKLYNGELDGRIEDIRLRWNFEELRAVVTSGCGALNVVMGDEIVDMLARAAYSSVGLLQELCFITMDEAGVRRRQLRSQRIENSEAASAAIGRAVEQISSRFEPFLRKLPEAPAGEGREGFYRHLTSALGGRIGEGELLEGLDVDDVVGALLIDDPDLGRSEAVASLKNLEAAQRAAGIRPPVLAYDEPRERLILVDRRLLLFLKEKPTG
jgi:hypothetical protein